MTIETFGPEIAEAVKVYEKYVICIDKTPEEFAASLLSLLNKAIKALDQRAQTTKEFAAASANLYSVKLAWRNEVMHPNDTYTLEEADNLIRQVHIFMGQLAKVV